MNVGWRLRSCTLRRVIDERDMNVHQPSGFVEPGRRILIAQAEVEREVRTNLPGVVDVVILAGSPELNGQPERSRLRSACSIPAESQQTHCRRRPLSRIGCVAAGLKAERRHGQTGSHLVVLVLAELTAKPEGVLALVQEKLSIKLVGMVLVDVRPFRVIPEAAEA